MNIKLLTGNYMEGLYLIYARKRKIDHQKKYFFLNEHFIGYVS